MPPKKAAVPKGPTTKTVNKEKMKVVEDRTFGLKNKNKSKAVQGYCKQVKSVIMDGGTKKVSERANLNLTRSFAIREESVPKKKPSTRLTPRRRRSTRRRPCSPRSSRVSSRSRPTPTVKVSCFLVSDLAPF